jgi:hypothetical protein
LACANDDSSDKTTPSTGGTTSIGPLENFSFFVTSRASLFQLSGSANGFGGDLRYGQADGLAGADKICAKIADLSMPGASAKGWRAFLSVTAGPDGNPVNAIDRIGEGPWYDRLGRMVSPDKASLLNPRPIGANASIVNDLPNEFGTMNSTAEGKEVNNHDTLTGTTQQGQLAATTRNNTCNDWTSAEGALGQPQIGHSWRRNATDGINWIAEHPAPGCAAGASEVLNGGGLCVGCSGGYGGVYCFALKP